MYYFGQIVVCERRFVGTGLEGAELTSKFSKTQIDRLGDRLKKGRPTEDDLDMLDEYRRSFGKGYETVVRTVSEQLGFQPMGRPAKSTISIVEKLRRESIRLSQMHDIAGCRVIVDDFMDLEGVVRWLINAFPESALIDRCKHPSHGYRAVHVVPKIDGQPIEIQVRTELQHLWASLSEKFADILGQEIKYGRGRALEADSLKSFSEMIWKLEGAEMEIAKLPDSGGSTHAINPSLERKKQSLGTSLDNEKKKIVKLFVDLLSSLDDWTRLT